MKGGLARRTAQSGSAHSFESAELYAKISGFLKEQHVDIGSHVKRGDLLAEIDVPELTEDVDSAQAALQQARAEVAQAEAQVESAIADQKSAESRIAQMKSDVQRCEAEVGLAQKQYDRIRELNGLKGIEDRMVDERLCQLQSTQAAHRSSQSTVIAAGQQSDAAKARIALAKAELEVSKSKVTVAESQLDRAKVMQSYTKITSPYDGVVTCRNFYRGAYVRSPDHGWPDSAAGRGPHRQDARGCEFPNGTFPTFSPEIRRRSTSMPLPQRDFVGAVARIAESEEPATRTMLVEIDLPNADGVIRNQMYGRVEIELDESLAGVTIPSTCLVGDVVSGQGKVFVVSGDHVSLKQIQVGKDTGIEVEVLAGISTVPVLRPQGSLADGAKVAIMASPTSTAKAH